MRPKEITASSSLIRAVASVASVAIVLSGLNACAAQDQSSRTASLGADGGKALSGAAGAGGSSAASTGGWVGAGSNNGVISGRTTGLSSGGAAASGPDAARTWRCPSGCPGPCKPSETRACVGPSGPYGYQQCSCDGKVWSMCLQSQGSGPYAFCDGGTRD